jgi:hypothetical protein
MDMVYEVRRQFKKFQELWKELENQNMLNVFLPNSLREMMLPRNFDYWFSCYCTSWEASLC